MGGGTGDHRPGLKQAAVLTLPHRLWGPSRATQEADSGQRLAYGRLQGSGKASIGARAGQGTSLSPSSEHRMVEVFRGLYQQAPL